MGQLQTAERSLLSEEMTERGTRADVGCHRRVAGHVATMTRYMGHVRWVVTRAGAVPPPDDCHQTDSYTMFVLVAADGK